MKVVITGGNGFVGLNVVSALVEAGHEVRAYVRANSNVRYLQRFPVTLFTGALDDASQLRQALSGADAIIHCAGDTSTYAFDIPRLRAANVEGTRAVARAALDAGVKRFVYTSTTSTIGATDDPERSWDESTPLSGFRVHNPYGRTKIEAEQLLKDAMKQGLEPVILNPAEVLGPWDHTLQWGRMVLAVCHNQVPFVPPGSASFCSAIEVGRAHVAALTRGIVGERHLLAGPLVSYRVFLDQISEVAKARPHLPGGNYTLRLLRARLQAAAHRFGAKLPMVDPYRMRVFAGHYGFDSSRAIRELGYSLMPLRQMIEGCWQWYRGEGMVPAPAERAS